MADAETDGNRFNPKELFSKRRAYVVREDNGTRSLDVVHWDVTVG